MKENHRSINETAILLATILMRSGQSRARISGKTIKVLAGREALRHAFFVNLSQEMVEYGWAIFETERGYGAVSVKALDAAKSVTAKRYLDSEEKKALRENRLDFDELELELIEDNPIEED